jgi:hypothetical protein
MILTKYLNNFTERKASSPKETPEPCKRFFSHREDVTLNNPLSPPARGWEQVAEATDRAASPLRDGDATSFETIAKYVTPELA